MYTWKIFYNELARKLLDYKDRQGELLSILDEMRDEGLKVIGPNDRDSIDNDIPLSEIDPFTFFANFNRAITFDNYYKIVTYLKKALDISAPAPINYNGIPTVDMRRAWFFPYLYMRPPENIKDLWRLAEYCLTSSPKEIDKTLFKRCLDIHTVAIAKLTTGLYWLNPESYLPLDRKTQDYLERHGIEIGIDKHEPLESYCRILDDVVEELGNDFVSISHKAYSNSGKKDSITTTASTTRWTDKELTAVVKAYFQMLNKELLGESYNKTEVNRKLRASTLSNRNKGAIERRMQNISAVLKELHHPIISGYLPAKNIGTKISQRIKNTISRERLLQEKYYKPTYDDVELDSRTGMHRKTGVHGKPKGQRKPEKKSSSNSQYERDPEVKAWVLNKASGTCELCDNKGPFKDRYGYLFLEVHHVVWLAKSGSDTPDNAVALCPNCHRKCHYSKNKKTLVKELQNKVPRLR